MRHLIPPFGQGIGREIGSPFGGINRSRHGATAPTSRSAPLSFYVDYEDGLDPPIFGAEFETTGSGAIQATDYVRAEYSPVADFSSGVQADVVAFAETMAFPTLNSLADGTWYARLRVQNTLLTPTIVSAYLNLFQTNFTFGDSVPDAWDFVDQSNVALSTPITSAAATPTGYAIPARIDAIDSGLEYQINSTGSWLTTNGYLNPGQTIRVRITSSGINSTQTEKGLSVGGTRVTFKVETLAAPADVGYTLLSAPAEQTAGAAFIDITVTLNAGLNLIRVSSGTRRINTVVEQGASVSASLLVENTTSDSAQHVSIWVINMPTGGSKTVRFSNTTPNFIDKIAVNTVGITNTTGAASDTAIKAYGYNAAPIETADTINFGAGGMWFAVGISEFAGGDPIWSVGVEDYDIAGTWRHASAHGIVSGVKPTMNAFNFSGWGMVAVSLEKI